VLLSHEGGKTALCSGHYFRIYNFQNSESYSLRPVIIDEVNDNALTSMVRYYNMKEACEKASGHFTLPPIITTNVTYNILLLVVT
jgi:hypothetical protein